MATTETNSELGQADRRGREALRPLLVGGAGRDQPDRGRAAPRAGTSGTTTASATSTSPRSSSTSRSATATRRSSQAIKEQAEKLATIGPPMATESRSRLGKLLAEVTPGDLTMSFFTNGGAEANENAIKLARWYTGRHKVIARYRSYHGATGRRDHADRRSAPLARRAGHPRRRAHVRPVHLPLPGRPSRSVPGLHRARRTSRRSSSTRARTPSPP